MTDYQRILSYLYRYEKAEKKECFGFVKAEQKSGSLKLTIQIDDERLLQGMELKLCFYERQGESWQVWQLDTLITQEHKEDVYKRQDIAIILKNEIDNKTKEQFINWSADMDIRYDRVFSIIDIKESNIQKWGDSLPFYRNVKKEGIVPAVSYTHLSREMNFVLIQDR